MVSVLDELKQRARLMQRDIRRADPRAIQRLRTLRELRALDEPQLRLAARRRHCLAVFARELGLHGWSHLTALWEQANASDFGALLYPSSCAGHWNIWSASYEEARAIRAEHGGYLLPYRHQFVIVDGHFVRDLGLAPTATEWALIGRDWVRPPDLAARHRLCRALLCARLEQSSTH